MANLRLRLLGSLSVSQGRCAVALPASRKTRALLAYLALAPRPVPRHRLGHLLWDATNDPRGELRWALSKLRATFAIIASGDALRLDLTQVWVDALEVQRVARAGISTLTPARARQLLELFDGEFLEGLELDDCPELTAWVLAQRRSFNAWRDALLIRLAADSPGEAESYDYYLQGRQHLARMMKRGLEASRRMFAHALDLDARYAPAWAGLATVHACLYEWFDPREAGLIRAEQASRRALEIAPRLAQAHAARGLALSLSRHYDEACAEFHEAIRLNPDLYDGYYYFARTAFAHGDLARAAEMFGLAAQLRPEDFQSALLMGTAARALGRDSVAHDAMRTGIRRAEQVLALNPHDGRALSLGAVALVDAGQTERALDWSQRCLALYPDDTSALVNVACVHARAGQNGESLDLLERVFAQGCGKRDWVVNDPDYAGLRNEPRFHTMLGRLR